MAHKMQLNQLVLKDTTTGTAQFTKVQMQLNQLVLKDSERCEEGIPMKKCS